MVSANGEKKENKKVQKPVTANSPKQTNEIKSPTSPRPLTKQPSATSIAAEPSEKQEVSAPLEPIDMSNLTAPIKKTASKLNVTGRSPTPSDTSMYSDAQPQPPPSHFAPFVVRVEPIYANSAVFTGLLKLNRNMVIRQVKREMMTSFIPGDQICAVNEVAVWNRSNMVTELKKAEANAEKQLQVTVIRAWNIFPPPQEKLDRLSPAPDERLQYFCVRIQFKPKYQGFSIVTDRKRVLISAISGRTAASYSFLVGDQLLAIGDEILVTKGKKLTGNYVRGVVTKQMRGGAGGLVTVLACRPIADRSSPNPSVDAELAERKFGVSDVTGKSEKKTRDLDELSPALEGDALEIALREMCCFQQSLQANNQLPQIVKSRSLLRTGGSGTNQSVMTAPTSPAEKSLYGPPTVTSSMTSVMGAVPGSMTPKKKKQKKQTKKQQKTIEIREATETEKITSDIPEDEDLKKCDPRSGIVAYIRNAFNN